MTGPATTRPPMALLLDDDATVLRLLGTALQARGFEVRAAGDGVGGLALLLDELLGLDVVVVDADLPGRDAADLLHLVRWAGGERELGIVVLGEVDGARRDDLLALGADAVIDRRAGQDAALEAIAAVARRSGARAPALRLPAGVRPALEGALLLARAA